MSLGPPLQWDVHLTRMGKQPVLIIQNDLLLGVSTYLVAPLISARGAPKLDRRLLPTVIAGDEPLVAMILSIGSLSRSELGERIASAEHARDDVTHALDMVLSGI